MKQLIVIVSVIFLASCSTKENATVSQNDTLKTDSVKTVDTTKFKPIGILMPDTMKKDTMWPNVILPNKQ
jgi:PBP1b-binding outer membrane lipoprotein LpoB